MLMMVIERFRSGNTSAIGERFRRQGRMLAEGVRYRASWVDPVGSRCFQLMEAADPESLTPWVEQWRDLVELEIIPVLTSHDFWSSPAQPQ
jgi:Domain of unknown function (DUF3303)